MLKKHMNKILLLICTVVVGFLVFDTNTAKNKQIPVTGLLDSVFLDEFDFLSVGDFLALQKKESHWFVVKPYTDWANKTRLEDLVSVFVDAQFEKISLSETEISRIFKESYKVLFKSHHQTYEFNIATVTQFENKSYVQNAKSKDVYLTDAPVREKVGLGPENYRLKQIVKGDFENIISVEFKSGSTNKTLSKTYKQTDDIWKSAAFKSQLNSLFYMFYQKNIDKTLFDRILKKESFQMQWHFKNNQIVTVIFYEEKKPSLNRYAIVDNNVYLISDADFKEFFKLNDIEKSIQ